MTNLGHEHVNFWCACGCGFAQVLDLLRHRRDVHPELALFLQPVAVPC